MPEAMRIIPLGGLGEVGKNMTVYEYGDDAIVIDAGLAFPRDEHLGVDLILPDFTYLRERERPVRASDLRELDPEAGTLELGGFRTEFVRMAHSVPDAVAVVLETEAGRVLHTGDWKLDHTPVDGLRTDVGRLAEIGNRGVDLLLGDSTNAERPGVTGSERLVGEAFRQIIPQRTGCVLVASFASNVHRMQQATDVAVEVGRKVCVVGR